MEVLVVKRECSTCEYYSFGDCHNRESPRFTPEPEFVCGGWYPSTTEDGEPVDIGGFCPDCNAVVNGDGYSIDERCCFHCKAD